MKNGTCKAGFTYTIVHFTADGKIQSVQEQKNIIPIVGIDYLIGAALKGSAQFSSWYMGIFGAVRTPVAGDTMTTLMADCEEITSYTGGARPLITFSDVVNGGTDSIAAPNVFEFPTAETVRGAFITSNPTQLNNSGLLLSALLFASPEVMKAGASLKIPTGFGIVSA